jgi:hypothetical protein
MNSDMHADIDMDTRSRTDVDADMDTRTEFRIHLSQGTFPKNPNSDAGYQ